MIVVHYDYHPPVSFQTLREECGKLRKRVQDLEEQNKELNHIFHTKIKFASDSVLQVGLLRTVQCVMHNALIGCVLVITCSGFYISRIAWNLEMCVCVCVCVDVCG